MTTVMTATTTVATLAFASWYLYRQQYVYFSSVLTAVMTAVTTT